MDKENAIYRKGYMSELDRFFHDFDKNRTDFPPSRLKEVAKHQRIFEMRDLPKKSSKKD